MAKEPEIIDLTIEVIDLTNDDMDEPIVVTMEEEPEQPRILHSSKEKHEAYKPKSPEPQIKFYQKRLSQHDIAVVMKYTNFKDILNLSKTCKELKPLPELLHFNTSTIPTGGESLLKNLSTWHLYYDTDLNQVERRLQQIKRAGRQIWKVVMDDPLRITEARKFVKRHPEIEMIPRYEERLVMETPVITVNNGTFHCIHTNKPLDPNTEVIDTTRNCNRRLEKLDIENTRVRYLPEQLCKNMERLREIHLPSRLERIGEQCFYDCQSITTIVLPTTLTSIERQGFKCCYWLETVQLPLYLEKLGESCFSQCRRLRSISIPSLITSLGYSTFYNCLSLTSVELPSQLKHIDAKCFCKCSSLERIDLPDSVQTIGEYAFDVCHKLSVVNIPTSLRRLEHGTFLNTQVRLEIPTTVTYIDREALPTETDLRYPGLKKYPEVFE